MKKAGYLATTILFLLTLLVLSACAQAAPDAAAPTSEPAEVAAATAVPPTAAPSPTAEQADPLLQLATIESLQVLGGPGTADETSVELRGLLPNDCAAIDNIITERTGNEFNIVVLTVQRPGESCSTEPVPFEERVVLDVSDLEAGSYQVTANDRQVTFSLAASATAEPAPETSPSLAALNGIVWHDLCANGEGSAENTPEGCILTDANALLADGERQAEEEGIAGVQVMLGEGACPATAVASVTTDADGMFTFADLAPATYCVFVDTADSLNQALLGDGFWTAPQGETPQFTVSVPLDETADELAFGWDFLNLPAEAVDLANCENSFEFVSDLSIPDDTVFPPEADFTKVWQLRNNGTCPWTTAYSIVFVGGDQMGAADAYLLDQTVAPGQTLDVSIDMVAPALPGTYRGNWQVADADAEPFGIDGFIEDAFWLQIVVEEDAPAAATPLPNSGVIGGVVWEDLCVNSNPGTGCVETAEGSGVFVADGSFGSRESALSGIVISLAEGLCPADGTLPAAAALLETAVTDEAGLYRFEGLAAGSYCIFMDALSEANLDLLIPGNWTWPATGVGYYSFVLDPGEQALDLDFGWDFVE